MIRLFNAFVKLTGLPAALLVFRTKVYYEDKAAQGRHIKGAAVLVSNHTSVFDYAVYLFVFFTRTLRTLMAEVLFEKKLLALFLKLMGGIRIDRGASEYGYMGKCEQILRKGGVLCVFPEGRLPLKDETPPLPFRPGAAYLSLCTGTPVIPVYTDGAYFGKARARVIIGEPVIPPENVSCADPAAVEEYNRVLRQKIISLGELLEKRRKEEKA